MSELKCPYCNSPLVNATSQFGWAKCPNCALYVSVKTAKDEAKKENKPYAMYVLGKNDWMNPHLNTTGTATNDPPSNPTSASVSIEQGEFLPPLPAPTLSEGTPGCPKCGELCKLIQSPLYKRTMWACAKCQRWVARQRHDVNDNAGAHQNPDALHGTYQVKNVKLVWEDGKETKPPEIAPPVKPEVDPRKRKFR